MSRRNKKIARSITLAITRDDDQVHEQGFRKRVLEILRTFFYIYALILTRISPGAFKRLRNVIWNIPEQEYLSSFDQHDALEAKEDMGYSGSTFFTTKNNRYLVKSIPRRFEHTFFRDDLLSPYLEHMELYADSLLVRMTDFLGWRRRSLGGLLGFAPTYHLVMENLLHGLEGQPEKETFDLKPNSYFFPERDIAGGRLSSEATKSKLADHFDDKVVLTRGQADEFFDMLEKDTELLEKHNAVDYSLMLVRVPKDTHILGQDPFKDPPNWRTGIPSQDDKYLFRAVILDFFWAKHKTYPMIMTALIKVWNALTRSGPMSITTTAPEYRSRFLAMCREIVKVDVEDPGSSA